jgi:signal transduction histidine kinase
MRDPLQAFPVWTKLALLFVALSILAFGVGGYAVTGEARGALVSEITARIEGQSRDWAAALDAELRTLASRTEDFASDGFLRERAALLISGGNGSRDGVASELRQQLERKKPLVTAFSGIAIADADGRPQAATAGLAEPLLGTGCLTATGSAPSTFSAILVEPPASPPTMVISTPLRSLDGQATLGRLVTFVHVGIWVSRAVTSAGLTQARPGTPVQLTVTDHIGTPVQVSPLLTSPDAPSFDSELVRTGFGISLGPPRIANDDAAQHKSWPLFAPGWSAGVHAGPPDLSGVSRLQSRVLAFGIVLAALSLLLLYFPIRFLAQPLQRMREAARRIEGGDFSARVPVDSKDEIGQLARSFNTMACAIEERTSGLETAAAELARGQELLRLESDRLATVIRSMRDGLVVLDAHGHAVLSNAAAGGLLEVLRHHRQATSHHICRASAEHSSCTDCLLDPAAPARTCILDAGRTVLEVHATRLPGEPSSSGRVLVARDITDRVVQDERQIHQERLAVIGEVASIMAHELNNPLAAISMFSQMMEGDLPAKSPHRESVAIIRRNTDTCKRAIREVLDYATDATPEISPVDLHAVLEDVVRFLRPMRERAGVTHTVELGSSLPFVTGDEVQLRQVFVNLCLNAIQAMAPRGGALRLVTRDSLDHVEIDVVDSGPGIPPDLREKVFRPFFTTKARGEGTGLGLPTTRRIAEIHGGSVDLVSTGPEGTTFRVRFRRRNELPV